MKLRNWTRKRGALAIFGVILVTDLALGVQSASLAISAGAATTPTAPATSERTVQWDSATRDPDSPDYANFKNLALTVGQTENLGNQGISVTWSGGKRTSPGEYATDYLQLMQCWGDPETGPTPEQCQWGQPASNLGSLMGSNANGRSLSSGEDPAQSYGGAFLIPPPRNNPNQRAYAVPFTSVKGVSVYDTSTFFSTNSTNEVTAARTGEDGTGQVVFETQTSLEAPHLGCGSAVKIGTAVTGKPCWLVAVPRGEFNADGSPASTDASGRVSGSPLSATNWANRIQVKLGFEPIGASCAIGNAEQRTVGSELIAEAFTSWQSALCATGTTYGYSQIGDGEARRQVVSSLQGASGLGFVSDPLDKATTGDSTLTYAPVAASAIVVGFTIERNLKGGTPQFSKNGTPVTDLVLNQRLVAKLLTQSYRSDVPNGNNQPYVANNPRSIRNDPEFLRLNPDFNDFSNSSEPDGLMVALGSTDATAELWRWLQSDPDASEFLGGKADEWGMTINPAYKALALGTDTTIDSFPKADLSTYRQYPTIPAPGFGSLDLRPYVLDMHEGAYRARKADGNVKIVWDETRNPPSFVSTGPQLPGQRFSLTITDSTSAARYGLQTARLVNAAGKAVAPTTEGIASGIASLVPSSTDGVLVTDPDKRVNAAYPLSMLTYAVVNVCAPTLPTLTDYADLLEYAIGTGQKQGDTLGQLPRGYVPLTPALTSQAVKAEKVIRAEVKKPVCDEHLKPEPTPAPTSEPDAPASDSPEATVDPPVEAGPAAVPTSTPSAVPVATVQMTPASSTGATRYTFLAALLFALPCLAAGPLLLRRS